MNGWTLLGIAVGLAMDAFAASTAISVGLGRPDARQTFRLSWHFGLFQALMPVIGWLAGQTVVRRVQAWDHWVAFGLLAFVGGRMLLASRRSPEERALRSDPTRGWSLVMLSVATSIDALAVGMSFAALGVRIWSAAAIIGAVAAALSLLGVAIGRRLGSGVSRWAEVVGGLVLILIGCRILWGHLLVGP